MLKVSGYNWFGGVVGVRSSVFGWRSLKRVEVVMVHWSIIMKWSHRRRCPVRDANLTNQRQKDNDPFQFVSASLCFTLVLRLSHESQLSPVNPNRFNWSIAIDSDWLRSIYHFLALRSLKLDLKAIQRIYRDKRLLSEVTSFCSDNGLKCWITVDSTRQKYTKIIF